MTSSSPSTSQKPFHIAIVGGGITGLTLTLSLIARNISVTLYEQFPEFKEIGAGLGFHPGAAEALRICSPQIHEAFLRVCTVNAWPEKRKVWFDVFDGTSQVDGKELKAEFQILCEREGGGSVHRAAFLDQLVGLLPADKGVVQFGKRVEGVEQPEGGRGKVKIRFADGTEAEADAVVGCDGIKSRTREVVFGGVRAGYSGKFAYRGLIPMAEAVEALGEEKAANTSLWMGEGGHALTFPVSHGKFLNLVAFRTDEREWPDEKRLTLPATREEIARDFRGFGNGVNTLIGMISGKPDRWGLFDHAANPLPSYYKGRICLAGDAAHASTPHHGAGAGMSIEDVAVLAELSADKSLRGPEDMEAVFAAYDESRRERTQWLVRSSRRASDLYEWLDPKMARDYPATLKEINERQAYIWNVDMKAEVEAAREMLRRRLGERNGYGS